MENVIKHYKQYVFCSNFLIFMPVLITIYSARGITPSEALLIESIYSFSIILCEIPTGYLGDKIGHDRTVILGLIGSLCCYILFAFSYDFKSIVLVQVMLGFFSTVLSGSDVGSLSEILSKTQYKSQLVFKSIHTISMLSMCLAYVLSGVVISLNKRGEWILCIMGAFYFISAIVYLSYCKGKKEIMKSLVSSKTPLHHVYHKTEEHRGSCCLPLHNILLCGMLLGIVTCSYMLSQVYYQTINISSQWFGLIYCSGCILTMLFNRYGKYYSKNTLLCIPIMLIIPVFSFKILVLGFVICLSYIKARVEPFIVDYVMSHSHKYKATSMSMVNMLNKCFCGLISYGLSIGISNIGFRYSMLGIFIILTSCVIVIYRSNSLEN